MEKIWIVEDDQTLSALLQENLIRFGYDCTTATQFQDITQQFMQIQPHLVILDVSLPGYSGHYWCSEMRKISKVPILFLSSHNENMDIIMAINNGGDDYITKPFSIEILIAKMQALLRRTYNYETNSTVLSWKNALVNLADASLVSGEIKLDLTKNEFKILQLLLEQRNQVVSREQLMLKLWNNDLYVDENTLTVNLNRLRHKLEDVNLDSFIETRKGLGYILHD